LQEIDGEFVLESGPAKLPSYYLEELRQQGYTIMEGMLDPVALQRLKAGADEKRARDHAEEPPTDGFFWMTDGLLWSPEVCRAITNPIALWVIQQYLSTDDIHLCHQPVITTVKPADELLGTFPELGWHSDYPYHPGVFPDDHFPEDPAFGVQFNFCIDDFRADNAGTQFVPGSHALCRRPPPEFNEGGTRMGEGVHKDVQQFQVPAGSALIYDSRTWHRACYELNVSGHDRKAILNAVTPNWVLPMMDKTDMRDRYHGSEMPSLLTDRERQDVERLCNRATQPTPEGMPLLSERKKSGPIRKTGN